MNKDIIAKNIVEAVCSTRFNIHQIFIYGSFAISEEYNDIDVMVLVRGPITPIRAGIAIKKKLRQLSRLVGKPICVMALPEALFSNSMGRDRARRKSGDPSSSARADRPKVKAYNDQRRKEGKEVTEYTSVAFGVKRSRVIYEAGYEVKAEGIFNTDFTAFYFKNRIKDCIDKLLESSVGVEEFRLFGSLQRTDEPNDIDIVMVLDTNNINEARRLFTEHVKPSLKLRDPREVPFQFFIESKNELEEKYKEQLSKKSRGIKDITGKQKYKDSYFWMDMKDDSTKLWDRENGFTEFLTSMEI